MLSIMKKLLLGLFVWLIWLINFWFCDKVSSLVETTPFSATLLWYYTSVASLSSDLVWKTVCFRIHKTNLTSYSSISIWFRNVDDWDVGNPITIYPTTENIYFCLWANLYLRARTYWSNNAVTIEWDYFSLNWLLDEDLPIMSSLDCQVEYWLIPVSDIDQNYCVSNWLCSSSECPDISWSWDNWSALYINDIQHLGKPIINIAFPDYLDWDYTTTDNEFNLDIVWYPVDTEYIDWIIRTQNYKPTSEDFTQLVWMLAPYSKYLLFLLFIFIIWAWIKKPFKSKKL